MADIVERLRANAAGTTYLGDNDSDSDVMLEAAAEIARLRASERALGELLAVIFGDGGHRQAEINDDAEAGKQARARYATARQAEIDAAFHQRAAFKRGVEAAAVFLSNEDAVYTASRHFLPFNAAHDLAAAIRAIEEPT